MTGDMQHVGPNQVEAKERLFSQDIDYAMKSKTHLWTAVTVHVLSADALRRRESEAPIFDLESLRSVQLGCYLCEKKFEPRELDRKCKGKP